MRLPALAISRVEKLAGIRSWAASVANWTARLAKNPSGAMKRASGRSRAKAVKAMSISAGVLALKKKTSSPSMGAAATSAFDVDALAMRSPGLAAQRNDAPWEAVHA